MMTRRSEFMRIQVKFSCITIVFYWLIRTTYESPNMVYQKARNKHSVLQTPKRLTWHVYFSALFYYSVLLLYCFNDKNWPVLVFQLNLNKTLPRKIPILQRPQKVENMTENLSYDNMTVGDITLGKIMAKVSEEAKLSKRCTYHCIRAICVTYLDENCMHRDKAHNGNKWTQIYGIRIGHVVYYRIIASSTFESIVLWRDSAKTMMR